jgi:glutamine amidotransferase
MTAVTATPAVAAGPAAAPFGPAVVIDLGVGNLGNLARALAHLGAEPQVTVDPARVAAARRLVLPGVGAFEPPRRALRGGLEEALREALAGGAWLLGVCVGYPLLFEASEEFGVTAGLGLLPGRVTPPPPGVPRPHNGWNRVRPAADHPPATSSGAARGLFAGLGGEPWLYFVHGFAPEGVPDELVLATAVHGRAFPAAAGRGRVLGTQFHPEKSGEAGLAVLANFLAMSGGGEGGA